MAKILVVDDEESIRFTFKRFLSDSGHEVTTAAAYDEALSDLSKGDTDLVFSDILLGGVTGIDLLREVQARSLRCPVVMITGHPTVETASHAVRLGAFEYLTKPVRKETLLQVAERALSYKALVDEKERYRSNLEAIFRSVEDAIVTVDGDLTLVEMNEAAGEICGLSRSAIGQALNAADMGCGWKCIEALRETIEKKAPLRVRRLVCRRGNRSSRTVSIATYPLRNGQGMFSGAVMVIRDDTRLASLEEDLGERRQLHNMVGGSEAMQRVYALIETLSDVETTVLITGESGTGKELVAEAIHYSGERSDKPLVKVNCSALSENLLESELFGHVKGAFTGALQDKVGRFQRADGGTIFLDEIGDISPKMQASLLRVLQEKRLERVGDSTPIEVDVRIIAATNRNLKEKIERGEFREDLYYRLNVVEIPMPPLRERRDDIPLLVEHFLKKFNRNFGREIAAVSEDVERVFLDYPWSGNVRELEHALEHAFILCHEDTIYPDHLPAELRAFAAEHCPEVKGPGERRTIIESLRKSGGNRAAAAKALGVSERTIYRKIREHRITDEETLS